MEQKERTGNHSGKGRYNEEPKTDPYENLANGIVLLAVKDYRYALEKLKKQPKNEKAKNMKDEVEMFFRSEWYKALTSVDGEYLIAKLKEECKYE